MPPTPTYVLVTPARNEEKTIEETLKSVVAQTVLPMEWVIVSDESTDRTDEIVRSYAVKYSFIHLLRLENRPARSFSSVVFVTEAGIKHLQTQAYNYLGLLDSDIRLPAAYYETLMDRFSQNENLGLAGGPAIDIGTRNGAAPYNQMDVPGAVQFFRRKCFESLGGLVAIPEGGWDAITCVQSRMNGYQTRLFLDLPADHLKPRNTVEGCHLRRKWQMGIRDYALGYHPLFESIKCASRWKDNPLFISSLAWFLGYLQSALRGYDRILPYDTIHYIQKEQLQRLSCLFRQ